MREPDWAKVLERFYSENKGIVVPVNKHNIIRKDDFRNEDIPTGLDMESKDVGDALSFLWIHGLLEEKTITEEVEEDIPYDDYAVLMTSKKGFDVAHERELKRGETYRNHLIGVFTILLGTGAFLQGFLALFPSLSFEHRIIVGVAAAGMILVGLKALDSTIE